MKAAELFYLSETVARAGCGIELMLLDSSERQRYETLRDYDIGISRAYVRIVEKGHEDDAKSILKQLYAEKSAQ